MLFIKKFNTTAFLIFGFLNLKAPSLIFLKSNPCSSAASTYSLSINDVCVAGIKKIVYLDPINSINKIIINTTKNENCHSLSITKEGESYYINNIKINAHLSQKRYAEGLLPDLEQLRQILIGFNLLANPKEHCLSKEYITACCHMHNILSTAITPTVVQAQHPATTVAIVRLNTPVTNRKEHGRAGAYQRLVYTHKLIDRQNNTISFLQKPSSSKITFTNSHGYDCEMQQLDGLLYINGQSIDEHTEKLAKGIEKRHARGVHIECLRDIINAFGFLENPNTPCHSPAYREACRMVCSNLFSDPNL